MIEIIAHNFKNSFLRVNVPIKRGLALLSGVVFAFLLSMVPSFAAVAIDWRGKTITSADATAYTSNEYNPVYFTNATLTAGARVEFSNSHIVNGDFTGMVLKGGSLFEFDQVTFVGNTSFAGTTINANSSLVVHPSTFTGDVSFAGMTINANGSLMVNTSEFQGKADFSGIQLDAGGVMTFDTYWFLGTVSFYKAKINGELRFITGGHMYYNGTGGANFREAVFGVNSIFSVPDASDWRETDFTLAMFNGLMELNALSMDGSIFTDATFAAGSTTTITGGSYKNMKFDGTTFAGTFTASTMDFAGTTFAGAKFKGKTTLSTGGLANADFTGATFETGSDTKFAGLDLTGTKFNGVTVQNGASLFISGNIASGGTGLSFTSGSTVQAGGNLTVSDGWQTSIANSNFNGSKFQGTVLFGVTDNNEWNYFNMAGSTFIGTEFSGVIDFKYVNLQNSSFANAMMTGTVRFTGIKNGDYSMRAGIMTGVSFNGAYMGSGVLFDNVGLESTTYAGAVIDGARVNAVSMAHALLSGATITGNTTFMGGTYLVNSKFDGTIFNSVDGSIVSFIDANLETTDWGTTSFAGAIFNGNVLFQRGVYNGAIFAGARFNAGSNVTFEGMDMSGAAAVFGSTAYYGGKLTFRSLWVNGLDFKDAVFQSTSEMVFDGGGYQNIRFDGVSFGGTFSASGMDFAGTSFMNAKFLGQTTFTSGGLANANFTGATFDSGSTTRFDGVNASGLKLDGATLKNGALVYIKPGNIAEGNPGISFAGNATVQAGGRLTIGDGWQTSIANSMFDSSKLQGVVFFGVSDGNEWNYLNMAGSTFIGTEFSGVIDFKQVNLQYASFANAQMTGTVRFTGNKNEDYTIRAGVMTGASFNGAYMGSGVLFDSVGLESTTYAGAVIDGVTFNSSNMASALFNGATITGNTTFTGYTYMVNTKFDGTVFNSASGSIVSFIDANMKTTDWGRSSFAGAIFNGNVLFQRGEFDGVIFTGAKFNAGSNVTFDGVDMRGGAFFGSTSYAGDLTFQLMRMYGVDFSGAVFEATSNTLFDAVDMQDTVLAGITVKGNEANGTGGKMYLSGNVEGVSFAGAVFERNTEFSIYKGEVYSANRAVNFRNASFSGITRIGADDGGLLSVAGSDFTGASFNWDSTKGTMFHLQNTGFTYNQLVSTNNYNKSTGRFDMRGMNLSNNTDISGRDFRRSKIDGANFSGLWANDFRDATYGSSRPVSFGESYIDAAGNLGGLNKHTSANMSTFLIREKAADSSLWVNLLADSTRINSGVTLQIGSYNNVIAQGGHSGLEVAGKLSLDSTSVLHMRDGATLNFLDGSILEVTVQVGQNYIVIADIDSESFIEGLDLVSLSVLGDPYHDWQLDFMASFANDNNAYGQLVLYYTVPIPEPSISLMGVSALAMLAARRGRRR